MKLSNKELQIIEALRANKGDKAQDRYPLSKNQKKAILCLFVFFLAAFSVQQIYYFFTSPSPIVRGAATARMTSAARLPPPSTIKAPSFHRKNP